MRLTRLFSALAIAGLVASACAPAAAPAPTAAPTAAAKPAAAPAATTAPAAAPTTAPAAAPTAAPAAQPTTAAAAKPATGASIKLGAIIPLTGPSAASGQDMKDGMELAREQVNAAGGVNGRPIEILYEDDKNDPATAVASFEKLVNNDKVEVMIGGLASTITAALIEPAKKAQVPMAWMGAAATTVEQGFQGQDWFFHYHPWEYQNAAGSFAFMKATPYKTWAIAYEDGLFGTGGAKGFQDGLPKQDQQVVAAEAFKSGSTDFTALINKLKASNADGLILIPFAADVVPFLTQMREVGWKPKLVYASPPGFPPDFEKSPVAEGVAGLTIWTPDVPAPASKQFVADFTKKYNHGPIAYVSAMAFSEVVTVADSLKKVDGAAIANKDAWIKAMEATSYDSPLGQKLTFKPSQYIKHQGFTDVVSFQFQGGKQQIVFPDNLATAKLKS